MRRRLIGNGIRPDTAFEKFRQQLRRIADQANRCRLTVRNGPVDERERCIERVRASIEIAGLESLVDTIGLALDRQHRRAGHCRRKRLCAAHATQSRRQNPTAR